METQGIIAIVVIAAVHIAAVILVIRQGKRT